MCEAKVDDGPCNWSEGDTGHSANKGGAGEYVVSGGRFKRERVMEDGDVGVK